MDPKRCFEPDCMLEVEYSCQCTPPETLSCALHVTKHINLPDKIHTFNTIFMEPCKETREAILGFFTKEMSKNGRIKSKILNSFSNQILNSENDLKELIKNIDSSTDEIANCYAKISQVTKLLKSEQDPILELLTLQPDEAAKKIKSIIPDNRDWYNSSKVFCGFSEKIEKMIECFIKDKFETYLDSRLSKIESTIEEHDKNISLTNKDLANLKDSVSGLINENNKSLKEFEDWKEEINEKLERETSLLSSQVANIFEYLNSKKKEEGKQNDMALLNLRDKRAELLNLPNDSELEEDFRKTCSSFQSYPNIYDSQVMQAYHEYVSTYHQNASIYNVVNKDNRTNLFIYDTESERKEIKILQTPEILLHATCITPLPHGKLFCYGKHPASGITLIIDWNCGIQVLPSGTPCFYSSAIYFKKNVYCFGGKTNDKPLNLSSRFDLDLNQWIMLPPMPEANCSGSSIIFNRNILIAWWKSKNLLRYSLDENSFIVIPFEFEAEKRKILINAERLYLIECANGSIYESEIESDTAWRRIADSIIAMDPTQIYCSYNKETIYIGCCDSKKNIAHFKFGLGSKRVAQLS